MRYSFKESLEVSFNSPGKIVAHVVVLAVGIALISRILYMIEIIEHSVSSTVTNYSLALAGIAIGKYIIFRVISYLYLSAKKKSFNSTGKIAASFAALAASIALTARMLYEIEIIEHSVSSTVTNYSLALAVIVIGVYIVFKITSYLFQRAKFMKENPEEYEKQRRALEEKNARLKREREELYRAKAESAIVVSKTIDVRSRFTDHYILFELSDRRRLSMKVTPRQASHLVEGDSGVLIYRNFSFFKPSFISFERY